MDIKEKLLKTGKLIIKQKALTALITIFVLMSIFNKAFLTPFNITSLFVKSITNWIVALGVTLTIIAGAVDLSVGGTLCMAGIIVIGLQPFMPIWLAILIALMVGALIGFVNGYLSVNQKTEPFIITLGIGILLKGINLQLTDARPISGTNMAFARFGSGSVLGIPYILTITVLLIVLFIYIMRKTEFGRNLYAIGGDFEVAVHAGIKAARQKWMTFVISGITASIAGILLSARLNTASANYGDTTALLVNCAIVVGGTSFKGGVGGIWQSVVGILLLSLIENSLNLLKVNSYIQMAIIGAVIIYIIGLDLFDIKKKKEAV